MMMNIKTKGCDNLITNTTKNNIIKYVMQGLTYQDTAIKCCCSSATVGKVFREADEITEEFAESFKKEWEKVCEPFRRLRDESRNG